jgi:hypothetical protein
VVKRMLNWSKLLVFVPVTVILVVTPGPNSSISIPDKRRSEEIT